MEHRFTFEITYRVNWIRFNYTQLSHVNIFSPNIVFIFQRFLVLTVHILKINKTNINNILFQGITHAKCTLDDADDGKPWCSTLTDGTGHFHSDN